MKFYKIMKLRKVPYYSLLFLLTIGASLILGFLSFGGMFALWPIISIAAGAFILSVGYEGEIYFQNIRGSLNKLLKHHYLQREIANEYLLHHFPDTNMEDCPQFFRDYKKQLKLFHKFTHKRLDKKSKLLKKQEEKKLQHMEKWFAIQLFTLDSSEKDRTLYEKEVQAWLAQSDNHADEFRIKYSKRQHAFQAAKAFSIVAGLFMGIGSTYLLVEAFAIIPLLAAIPFASLPLIIVPMAIIAGTAYGMLIYNAVTDMISNDTLRTWYFRIRNDWNKGARLHSILMAAATLILASLAVSLTICTAGTWWTIAKTARPLFSWMGKMPTFIMGIINPIIVGIASTIFAWQNTNETLEMIDKATRKDEAESHPEKENLLTRIGRAAQNAFHHLRAEENWGQILNPFRIILKTLMLPLRIILFLGHLIGMGVSGDRVPGIPEWLAAVFGTTSEFFEDLHYFFGLAGLDHHEHHHHSMQKLLEERLSKGHSHSHDNDLPTRFLNLLFLTVYGAAAGWDYVWSKRNSPDKQLSLKRAWEKQWGLEPEKTIAPQDMTPISSEWRREHALYRIERYKEKHLQNATFGKSISNKKMQQLTQLQHNLRQLKMVEEKNDLSEQITRESKKEVYKHQRFFLAQQSDPTATECFLTELAQEAKNKANHVVTL